MSEYIFHACQSVYLTPWQCTLSHACHAKEAEPEGRQSVHPTPWQYYDDQNVDSSRHMEQMPSSPIAPAHKRARSVDAGRADQPSGPPIKLPTSKSVGNLLPTGSPDSSPAQPTHSKKKSPAKSTLVGPRARALPHHRPKLRMG